MPCACKVGTLPDEQREWVEKELLARRPLRTIEKDIKERYGVTVYAKSLLTHKNNHMNPAEDEWAIQVDEVRDEILELMNSAPSILKPAYLGVLSQMAGLKDGTASLQGIVQAIKLLNDITGSGNNDGLIDFAVKRAQRTAS